MYGNITLTELNLRTSFYASTLYFTVLEIEEWQLPARNGAAEMKPGFVPDAEGNGGDA